MKQAIIVFIFFKIYLFFVEKISIFIPHSGTTLLGPIPWANFDGAHYLTISDIGYLGFEQAFFPLFPTLVNLIHRALHISYLDSALLLVNICFLLTLVFFIKLIKIDYSISTMWWVVIAFLSFPSSFFLLSIYTESLFLFLVFGSVFFARRGNFLISSIFGGLSSATRLVGVFLLPVVLYEIYLRLKNIKKIQKKDIFFPTIFVLTIIPLGFIIYMVYLAVVYGDPLLFIHSQPAFGANRSGGEIILLPQVVWRYISIFLTVPYTNYDFWKAWIEFIIFFLVLYGLYVAYKKRVRLSYIMFSFAALILPTLSGTLSSIPRYALVCFAIFFLFPSIKNIFIRSIIIIISLITETVLAALFLRGYFVG